jgi:hypothetical protein
MEKIIISVAQAYKFSSNLEAEPLMVQLVNEGGTWRLRLASPVVGVAGGITSFRYVDYYKGYLGRGYDLGGSRLGRAVASVASQRFDDSSLNFGLFEHVSAVNSYFYTVGISSLVKDLNLLQLKLHKNPNITVTQLRALVEKQLRNFYWDGFSLGKSYVENYSPKLRSQNSLV